jgi:DUF4097 and DUF4098 domain-containing protein YvlB
VHVNLIVRDTSNGSIEVRLPTKFDDDVRAHTSNGGITLRVPGDLNARLAARTSNGRLTSDVEVARRARSANPGWRAFWARAGRSWI